MNPTDPVWSIFVMMLILLAAVVYVIVYIMRYDEMTNERSDSEGL